LHDFAAVRIPAWGFVSIVAVFSLQFAINAIPALFLLHHAISEQLQHNASLSIRFHLAAM